MDFEKVDYLSLEELGENARLVNGNGRVYIVTKNQINRKTIDTIKIIAGNIRIEKIFHISSDETIYVTGQPIKVVDTSGKTLSETSHLTITDISSASANQTGYIGLVNQLPFEFELFDPTGARVVGRQELVSDTYIIGKPRGFEPFWATGANSIDLTSNKFAVCGSPLNRIDVYTTDLDIICVHETLHSGTYKIDLRRGGCIGAKFDHLGRIWIATADGISVISDNADIITHVSAGDLSSANIHPLFNAWWGIDRDVLWVHEGHGYSAIKLAA